MFASEGSNTELFPMTGSMRKRTSTLAEARPLISTTSRKRKAPIMPMSPSHSEGSFDMLKDIDEAPALITSQKKLKRHKLKRLKEKIYRTFPWTKFSSRLIKRYLKTFLRDCLQQFNSFADSEQWKSSGDYAIMALKSLDDLPDWDDLKNNKDLEECYKKLALHMADALIKGNFSKQKLQKYLQILQELKQKRRQDNGIQNCIKLIATKLSEIQFDYE